MERPTHCIGCNEPITQPERGRRLWCGQKCRKATTYARSCLDCGESISVSDKPDRCLLCSNRRNGVQKTHWTEDAIIGAILAWNDLHGSPPKVKDFLRGDRSAWPSIPTVGRVFGGWSKAIAAAGLRPRPRGHQRNPLDTHRKAS
jgi:hypothetical protein